MKKILLFLLSLAVGIGLFIWVVKMVGWEELKSDFMLFTGVDGLIIICLTFLTLSIGTWRWKEILKGVGVDLPFKKLITPFLAGFSIIYLVPIIVWGGEVLRSYVLRQRNDVSWAKSMASVVIDRIMEWSANLTVIFFGGLVFLLFNRFPINNLVIIFVGVFMFFLAALIFFFVKCYKRESIASIFLGKRKKNLFEIEKEIFNFFKYQKKAIWKAAGLSFLRASVMFVRVWFLIFFLGKTVGFLTTLSVLGFSYLAVMIPIPTALGTSEAIQSFAFNTLGIGISTAPAFTMIIRGAEIVAALIGLILLFRVGVLMMKDKLLDKIENLGSDD